MVPQQSDTTFTFQINFLKEGCGPDNICQSNLEMEYKFVYKEPNQNVFRDMPM